MRNLFRYALRVFSVAPIALAVLAGFMTPARAANADFTVVTLNLWHDKADWPKRQALIVKTLRELHPDVIALQEVLQHEGLPNQARTLASALGYHAYFSTVDAPGAPKRYGNAVLTRHRVIDEEWKALLPLDDYRTVAHLRIAIGKRTLDVYATHLNFADDGAAVRREQAADLLAYERAHAPADGTLVLGDFNAPADAPELAALAGEFRDAYDTRHPDAAQNAPEHSTLNLVYYAPLRIDHVMFDPRRFEVLDARRLFDRADANGTWASDHYGIWTRLRWRK